MNTVTRYLERVRAEAEALKIKEEGRRKFEKEWENRRRTQVKDKQLRREAERK